MNRRQLLQFSSLLPLSQSVISWSQSGKSASPSRNVVIAQIVDFSQEQRDVSKDFLAGSRAVWLDINSRGGIHGKNVTHLALETVGTPASLRVALDSIKDNPFCVVLSGSVGDRVASQILALSRQNELNFAHAAPWLQNSSLEVDDKTFTIFAARQEQISYALKNLSVMGMSEIGAIYATTADFSAYHFEVERIAAASHLKLQTFQGMGDLQALGRKLTPRTPAVLLFVGGTPELAAFTNGMEKQARQRFVVALADVNLQTMADMGATRTTAVIATQPVPLVNARLPLIRSYRETMSRLFDEPPTPLSLAGYIAARYTYEVLNDVEGPLTRQSVLNTFRKKTDKNLGGFRVSFDAQGRSTSYVAQSMMTPEGRLIG